MNTLFNEGLIDFKYLAIKKAVRNLEHPEIINGSSIGEKLMDILNNSKITTLFQPIVSLKDGSIFGYEALSRGPENTVLENPSMLFDIARVHGKLWDLEFLCRIKALEKASMCNDSFHVFINVDPDIINDEKFKSGFTKEFLKKFEINPQNIVFEITEKNSIEDIDGFNKLISNYKDQGFCPSEIQSVPISISI